MKEKISKIIYHPHIDGLRALAIIIVILFHLNPKVFPGGYLGVDIFFVISGFVITQSLFKEYIRNGNINILNFYVRRLKRLYPALLLMVSVVTIFYTFFGLLQGTSVYLKSASTSILAVSNFYFIFQELNYFNKDLLNPLIHTWSLGIEEQFYLIYPGLLVIGLYVIKKVGLKFTTLASLILGLSVVTYISFILNQDNLFGNFYFPLARFWELGFGAALFFFTQRFEFKKFATDAMWLSFLVIFYIQFLQSDIDNLFLETLLVTSATVALIYAGINSKSGLKRILASRIMTYIGKISYSLYLWHFPIIYFMGLYIGGLTFWILTPVVFTLVAIVSYHFFENPLRYSQKLTKCSRSLIKGIPYVVVVVLLGILIMGTPRFLHNMNKSFWIVRTQMKKINYIEGRFDFVDRVSPKYGFDKEGDYSCGEDRDVFISIDRKHKSGCLKKTDDKILFYLTGDSHAQHFTPTFDESSIVKNLYFVNTPRELIFEEGVNEILSSKEGELKNINDRFDEVYYVTSFFYRPWQRRMEIIEKNLEEYIEVLGSHANLIFITETVRFPQNPEGCILKDEDCSVDKEEDLRRIEKIRLLLKKLENKYDNVYVYDPYDAICPDSECVIYDKDTDTLVLRDRHHLSVEFSKTLASHLDSWLKETFDLKE